MWKYYFMNMFFRKIYRLETQIKTNIIAEKPASIKFKMSAGALRITFEFGIFPVIS